MFPPEIGWKESPAIDAGGTAAAIHGIALVRPTSYNVNQVVQFF
jgi:hypothetical protein